MKKALILSLAALLVSACELPNVKKLNTVPDLTEEMSNKMDTTIEKIEDTNEMMVGTDDAIHKQTLLVALTELNKYENQALVFPLPTGLMAAAKAFAEKATDLEIIELTYIWLREIEEVNPAYGLDKDMVPAAYTEEQMNKVRLQKMARLYSVMAIAGFVPDSKDREECLAKAQTKKQKLMCPQDRMTEILEAQIKGRGRYFQTAFKFLALRGFFIREALLKTSLKVDKDDAAILETSGMMKEALKYLFKLDSISRLPYADRVQVKVTEKQYNLISFEEKQVVEGQKATAQMWKVALDKAKAGHSVLTQISVTSDSTENAALTQKEIQEQQQLIGILETNAHSWSAYVR